MTDAFSARRGRRRVAVAVVIVLAWVAGLVTLWRREFQVSAPQRLAEMAQRLSPGATFFVVEQGGKQIGFASNTIDTASTGIDVIDYFVADLPLAGSARRASARSVVRLSRALALVGFDVQVESQDAPLRAGGHAEGDTAIVFAITTPGSAKADSQRIAVRGPVYLPTLVPLVVALGEKPKVGRSYALPTFNPTTMSQATMRLTIRAESLFTLVDSARFDDRSGVWVSALTDTVRAWRVEPDGAAGGFSGWVDGQGRVVQSTQPGGITLRRMAYEIAFENWRIARDREIATGAGSERGDILERTAIAANAALGRTKLTSLRARLSGADLQGFDLDGGRQQFHDSTLVVTRESEGELVPDWSLVNDLPAIRQRFKAELASEPLLQANDLRIMQLAIRIAGTDRDPRVLAQKINTWVHDSLKKEIVFSVPNALEVLRTRKGDCNEHTQLYTALARSIGIPTRIATGLAYVNGKFYYHAWPEVWLKGWVAVDPTFGQFPADAAHLRFIVGGLGRQVELLRLIGNLHIKVTDAK
ncbi:MAG: transglutaminase domain-containing protein [Gemmatimonadetes bacterium]|nr:transglutaminase domain-containing protein [Gemmatimonadota bacterium]